MSTQRCDNCEREIDKREIAYWIRFEMFASPEPPVIEPDEADRDYAADMQRLIDQMEKMGPEECEDQVFESYQFIICPQCRAKFHQWLKNRKFDLS